MRLNSQGQVLSPKHNLFQLLATEERESKTGFDDTHSFKHQSPPSSHTRRQSFYEMRLHGVAHGIEVHLVKTYTAVCPNLLKPDGAIWFRGGAFQEAFLRERVRVPKGHSKIALRFNAGSQILTEESRRNG
jgi:hypothetical protein